MTNTNPKKKALPSRLEVFIILFSFLGMLVFSLFYDHPLKSIFIISFLIVFVFTNASSMNRVYTLNKSPSSPPFPFGIVLHAGFSFVVLFVATYVFGVSLGWQKVLLFYVAISNFLVWLYFLIKAIPHE